MPPPPGPQANGVPPQTAPSGRVVSGSSVDGGGPAGQQHSAAPVAGHVSDIPGAQPVGTIQKLAQANEQGWISIGE